MANNPVFSRFDRELSEGKYADLGRPQYGQRGQGMPYDPPARDPYGPPSGGYGRQGAVSSPGYPGQQQGYGAQGSLAQDFGVSPATPGTGGVGRAMTVDDVVMKTLVLFSILVASALVAWFVSAGNRPVGTALWMGGMVIGIALGFAIAFKKKLSVALILLYAVVEGVFVGAASQFFNSMFPGVVAQAVLGTACVFVAMFAGWKFGIVRVTARSRKMFLFAILGYFLFGMINFVLQLTGVLGQFGFFGMGAVGIGLCLLGIALASYSLAIDFDSITRATQAGLPEKYSWLMAHGLIVTVVWLYLELLRLLARLRN